MIKVILFDADGVLINTEMFSVQLERDYGISTSVTKPFYLGPFRECLIGKADLKEVLPPYLQEWGWNKGVDAFLDYWFRSEHKIDEELVAYIQSLRARGIKCCMATNQEKHRAGYMLEKMGFVSSFDNVFASAHLGYKKPSFEFYSKVMESLKGIEKEEVLFWDDSTENVEAASEFRIHAELYSTFTDFIDRMKKKYEL